ncbi:MAG: hypothetical protein J5616_00465 [Bacteroidaceae bacterium]|nr:hypothetical protein [Bacteroidaceae bacterium]
MNSKRTPKQIAVMAATALLLTACNFGRPIINGEKTGQPIMDGWTYEMAGEHWLPAVMTDQKPQTPEEVANLSEVNVQVKLPVHDGNPMPLDGVTYRQASTGGYITFHLNPVEGDTLNPIGTAEMLLKESGYFDLDTIKDVRLLSYGKGIFSTYHIMRQRQRGEPERYNEWVENYPAILSVYPGGDSLLICRGNFVADAYVAEKE